MSEQNPNPELSEEFTVSREALLRRQEAVTKFMLPYKCAIEEVVTKLNILKHEFQELKQYNPIEHVSSRLKSAEGILEKLQRRGILELATKEEDLEKNLRDIVRANVTDIAGIRVVCSFTSDVYHVFELLMKQDDVRILEVKDYIANPKGNGYRSLHVLLEIPVFLSTGPVPTIVEVQLRTIAMDFWASLEHKIYYKYEAEVPQHLVKQLSEAAETAWKLDNHMEVLHIAIRGGDRDTRVRRSADAMQAIMREKEMQTRESDSLPGEEA